MKQKYIKPMADSSDVRLAHPLMLQMSFVDGEGSEVGTKSDNWERDEDDTDDLSRHIWGR